MKILLIKFPFTDAYAKVRSKPDLWEGSYVIKEWVQSLINHKSHPCSSQPRFLDSLYTDFFRSSFISIPLPYEDVIMGLSFYIKDLVKLRSIVNRAIHIGKKGISELSSFEMDLLEDRLKLDILENDHLIKNFKLIDKLHFASSIHKLAFDINQV